MRNWDYLAPEQAKKELIALSEELEELRYTFELRWEADMRAIKRWQAAHPGRDLEWPDHADLVVFLLERLEQTEK